MAYDENGNLKKDLDRDIVTIRYNLLNLPDTIQFKNGNVIINHYSADGQKQRTDNYTRLTAITPVGENTVVNPENGYNDAIYSYTGTAYIGSFEYNIYKTKYQGYGGVWYYSDVFNPGKIYTPEGYIDYLSSSIVSTGVRYNYYRKDHLGNIREVWNGIRKNYLGQVKELASTRQRTQYYPSGLPWAESFGAAVQKNKFNGCEFIEMHGLDVTDLGNRGVHNATNRFTSIDRFAEKFPCQSPYVHAGNNPVNYVDVNGDSISVEHLSPEERELYNSNIELLSKNKFFKTYYDILSSSSTIYYIQAGNGLGGSGSYSNNVVSAELDVPLVLAQELFHAFQSELRFYDKFDLSVREAEGDLVTTMMFYSKDTPDEVTNKGFISTSDWDQGIGSKKYIDNRGNFNKNVLTNPFDVDFNNAVNSRIQFYKNRSTTENVNSPKSYVIQNSGKSAQAIKHIVKLIYRIN
jgi:RHS repeat-associated protein